MKKIMVFTLAIVIVFAAFALSQYDTINTGYAKSTPRNVGTDCPDEKTCYVAVQKTTGNTMCRHNTNDAWSWVLPKKRCGNNSKPAPTDTQQPPVVIDQPTTTPLPTATKQKASVPTDMPPDDDSGTKPTVTLTPTYISGENPQQICNWCEIALTDVAAQERQANAQETIAAELSK